MSVREDDFRFEIDFGLEEKKKSDNFLNTVIKSLLILLLLLGIFVLGIYAYKLLTKDELALKEQKIVKSKVTKKPSSQQTLSKEQMAFIIKTVITQLQKENAFNQPKITKKSEDSELLKSLKEAQENEKKEKLKKKKITKEAKDIVAKKPKIIKKEIVYNAVIIGNKEIRNTSDLARLYASINKIAKSKKKKLLKSAYTKKIKKEIIIREGEMRTVVVKPGDTLGSIAHRVYGKASMYKKIFEANPDLLNDPHRLKVGMRLRVPK